MNQSIKNFQDAGKKLDQAATRAMDIIYCTSVIVLWEKYGFRRTRIERFIDRCGEVFKESANTENDTLINKCDRELGIELRNVRGESYKDKIFLNADLWEKEKSKYLPAGTERWYRFMTLVQIKKIDWVLAQVTASIIVAIHRKEGWGDSKLEEFFMALEERRKDFDNDPKRLFDYCFKVTGIQFVHTKEGELAIVNK